MHSLVLLPCSLPLHYHCSRRRVTGAGYNYLTSFSIPVVFLLMAFRVAIFTARKRSLGQGNIFTPVCHSVHRGKACVVAPGGHVWLLRGACTVLFGGCVWFYSGGHAWFYSGGVCGFIWGGMRGFIWGACMVLFGGMHGFIWGCVWFYLGGMHSFIWGCVVLFGGCVWFYLGGVHGFIWGACVALCRGHAWFYSGGACVVFSVFSDTMRYGQ